MTEKQIKNECKTHEKKDAVYERLFTITSLLCLNKKKARTYDRSNTTGPPMYQNVPSKAKKLFAKCRKTATR